MQTREKAGKSKRESKRVGSRKSEQTALERADKITCLEKIRDEYNKDILKLKKKECKSQACMRSMVTVEGNYVVRAVLTIQVEQRDWSDR